MGKAGTRIRLMMVWAVFLLLFVSAVGMGFRQLWLEGVFKKQQEPERAQSVEFEATITEEASADFSEKDEQFLMWLEQQMQWQANKEVREIAAEADYESENIHGPVRDTKPATGKQRIQMLKDIYSGNSLKDEYMKQSLKSGDNDDWLKGEYTKSYGAKEFTKISVSKNENVYINAEGEQWRVSELPDGTTRKVQVMPDGSEGEVYISSGYKSAK